MRGGVVAPGELAGASQRRVEVEGRLEFPMQHAPVVCRAEIAKAVENRIGGGLSKAAMARRL